MVTAIVLGSGTSNGVPMLGHVYPPEYLANPKNHRTRACLLIQGPEGNLLVDCPPEMRLQVTGQRIYDIDAVLITHTHADHVMGMDDLRSVCLKTHRPVQIYTLPAYQDDIRRIYPYAFAEAPAGVAVPRFEFPELTSTLEICGMQVKTFLVQHGKIPVIGLRVHNFAYITDVSEIPPLAWKQLQGLDTFIVDAVRRKPHPNHFHLEKALEVIAQLKPRRAILTHLGHDYDHDVDSKLLPPGVEFAYDGMRLEIPQ